MASDNRGDLSLGADAGEEESLALIHLHVPRTLKGEWVKRSRAEGQKLTDWIVSQVQAAELARTPTKTDAKG